ncbi:hypothetical protein DSO57_1010220 [Entomophthora muscae]|uniref:Uncharacterized protein n=1 Tax=Entomophthora muscae TaxID=34485 RepID=A0ACC2S8M5_9FUNG|nr:hypothetical protein DSO57_1010220 [Entomophthora muscae]
MSDYSSSYSDGPAPKSAFRNFNRQKAMMKAQQATLSKDASHNAHPEPEALSFPILQAPSSSFDDSLSDISEVRATMDALVDGADDVWLYSIVEPNEDSKNPENFPLKTHDQTAIFSWLTSLSGQSDSESASPPGLTSKDQAVAALEPPTTNTLAEEFSPDFDTLSIGSLLDLDALDDKALFGITEEQAAAYSAVDIGLFDGFTLEELLEPIESLPTLDRALSEAPDNIRAMLGMMTKQIQEGEKLGLSSLQISESFSNLPSPSASRPSELIHRKTKSASETVPPELPQKQNRLSLGPTPKAASGSTLTRSSTVLKQHPFSSSTVASPESSPSSVTPLSRLPRQTSMSSMTRRSKPSSPTKPLVGGTSPRPSTPAKPLASGSSVKRRPLSLNPANPLGALNKASTAKSLAPGISVQLSTPAKSGSRLADKPRPLSLNSSTPLTRRSKPYSLTKPLVGETSVQPSALAKPVASGSSVKSRPLSLNPVNPLGALNNASAAKSLAPEISVQPSTPAKAEYRTGVKPRPLSFNPLPTSRADSNFTINGKTFTSRIPVPSASKRFSILGTFTSEPDQNIRSAGLPPTESSHKASIQAFREANPNFVSRIPRFPLSRTASNPHRLSSVRGI